MNFAEIQSMLLADPLTCCGKTHKIRHRCSGNKCSEVFFIQLKKLLQEAPFYSDPASPPSHTPSVIVALNVPKVAMAARTAASTSGSAPSSA